jgi:glutathione S-transferase
MTQADITTVCAFTFLSEALNLSVNAAPYSALRALAARCEALPEFQSTKAAFFAPQG